jgi:hypothetical protein
MKYLVLVYEDERQLVDSVLQTDLAGHAAFAEKYAAAITSGGPLEPTSSARTVRIRGGEGAIRIGSCCESKEQLSAFYVIEAETIDDAARIGSDLSAVRHGCIEVRPFRQ